MEGAVRRQAGEYDLPGRTGDGKARRHVETAFDGAHAGPPGKVGEHRGGQRCGKDNRRILPLRAGVEHIDHLIERVETEQCCNLQSHGKGDRQHREQGA